MLETNKKPGESFVEYRERYFEQMSESIYIVDKELYSRLYRPVLEIFGINSPAFLDRRKHLIVISNDVPDPDYIDFLKTHELWEDFIKNKEGFNLERAFVQDNELPFDDRIRPCHRFAVLKDFQQAKSYGKIGAYMDWWNDFYLADIQNIELTSDQDIEKINKNFNFFPDKDPREPIIDFIKSNLEIRRNVYEIVKNS